MTQTQRHARSAVWLAAASLLFVAFLAPTAAKAWTPPSVTAMCAPDADHFEFTVTLDQESNENYDWSFGSNGPWTTVAGQAGGNDLVVVRGTGDLWVRWTSDVGVTAHTAPDSALCASPSPSATSPVQSETPPSASPTASPIGGVAPRASARASATATSGTALGVTGTPTATLPPTDTAAASGPADNGWRTVTLALAALVSFGLLLAPKRRRR